MSANAVPRFQATVQPWGNSLGLRITKAIGEMAHLERGSKVSIEITSEGLLIRPLPPERTARLPYSEEELLQGLTPHTAHADELPILQAVEHGA